MNVSFQTGPTIDSDVRKFLKKTSERVPRKLNLFCIQLYVIPILPKKFCRKILHFRRRTAGKNYVLLCKHDASLLVYEQ